jgi:hypothetical protein
MPTDSNGVYSLPPGYFVTAGQTVEPSQHNPPLEDIAAALTARLPRNGSAPMTGNLNMGTHKIIGLAVGTNPADAVRLDQLQAVASAYRFLKSTSFAASGTWTPDAKTRLAVLRVQGAGGGGGGADGSGSGVGSAAGGGGGAYVERLLTAGWGATETVTIGAPGAGGTGGGNGATGGTTSVGTLAVAAGGTGGQGATRTTATIRGAQPPGLGGIGSVAGGTSLRDLTLQGGYGQIGAVYGTFGVSGAGGNSFLGQGGLMRTEGQAGIAGRNFGGGGSGGCSNSATARDGGDGGAPIVIIEEWE